MVYHGGSDLVEVAPLRTMDRGSIDHWRAHPGKSQPSRESFFFHTPEETLLPGRRNFAA